MSKRKWKRKVLSLVVVFAMLLTNVSAVFASETTDPVYPGFEEAYQSMIALQDQAGFTEGTAWTNNTPYGTGAPKGEYYTFQGGAVMGVNRGVGCAAFAFYLSDTAFGNLPYYTYANGDFTFEDVKVGDILRINGSHFVTVLKKSAGGVIVAEGNYNQSVHWGRAMSETEVMAANFIVSRYPKGYKEDDLTANEIKASDTEADGLSWTLTNSGTLTVTGDSISDYSFNDGNMPKWMDYKEDIYTIVIEDGVGAIGEYAFYQMTSVLRVFIPDSVTSIGASAFYGDTSLLSVSIPGSVETIGNDAFRLCTSLISATVSAGVKTIGERAFHSCTSLQYIDFPKTIESIGAGAFTSCEKLFQVRFLPGTGNVEMGDNLFTQCWYLAYVVLPEGLQKLSDGMFDSCKSIQMLYIPASVTSLADIGGIGAPSPFTSAVISDIYFGGTESDWNTMKDSNAVIKNQLEQMNPEMHYEYMYEDPSATNGDDGFLTDDVEASQEPSPMPTTAPGNTGGSSGSVAPIIPTATATAVPDTPDPTATATAVPDTPGPTATATAVPDTPSPTPSPTATATAVPDTPGPTATVTPVPPADSSTDDGNTGNDDDLENGNNPDAVQEPLEEGETFTTSKLTYKVTEAGEEVKLVSTNSTATNITINTVKGTDGVEYKVTSIGSKLMQNNTKITSLTIGANVKTIGTKAFSGCTNLKTVTIGKNVTTVKAGAFKGCTKLTTVSLGKTKKSVLTKIGKNAFNGCKKLTRVTIQSTNLSSVGQKAFKGTKSSLTVKVPSKQLTKYKKLLKKAGLKAKQITK